MPVALAVGRLASRLHRLVRTSRSALGRLHSRAGDVTSHSNVVVLFNPSRRSTVSARECRHDKLVASLLERKTNATSPGFTEPTLPRKRSGQVSALFRPRPGRTRHFSPAPSRHVGIPTAANRRDRPQIGRTQRSTSRMSRGFARHEQAIARDASHGQDTAIGREAPPGQDIGNSREHGHFPAATLRWRSVSPPGRMSDLTDKTKLV
jgi:hypothetical protein